MSNGRGSEHRLTEYLKEFQTVCVLSVTTRYPKLYHVVAQHVDAVSSLCGHLVEHVFSMPQECSIKKGERERACDPVCVYEGVG